MSLATVIFLSGAITCLLYLLYERYFSSSGGGHYSVERRLNTLIRGRRDTNIAKSDSASNRTEDRRESDQFQNYVDQVSSSRKINNWLMLAGINRPLYQILLVLLSVSVVSFVVFVVFNLPLFICAAVILSIWVGPYMYFNSVRAKYIRMFSDQLPNALGAMVNTVMVGHTAESAIKLLVEVSPKPLAGEFDKIHKEMIFGSSFGEALKNLYQRIPTSEVQIMVAALAVQQRSGGNLAEILRNLERMIREYASVKREAKAITAESKISMIAMCALPFFVVIPQTLKNPEPFFQLIATNNGKLIYGSAAAMMLLGIAIFNKVTKLESF